MSEIDKAIKACKSEIKFYKNELKQPYMKEYKSTYDAYISGHDEAYANCVNSIESFEFIISVLKEKQQREWISVSERLPEKAGFYLVQYPKICTNKGMSVLYFYKGDEHFQGIHDDIEAWMPLPEPYKEAKP